MSQPDQFGNPNDNFNAPKQGGSGMKIVLIILGVIGGLGIATCGCCAGMSWWSVGQLGEAVKTAYGEHPDVQQHIGEITDISVNFTATGEEGAGAQVFDVEGTKGSGRIVARDQVGARFGRAELRVNGETYDLGAGGL